MQPIWIQAFCVLVVSFLCASSAAAQTTPLSITTSDVGVFDKVGGGLFTLNGKFDAEPNTMVVVLGGSDGGYMTAKDAIVMNLLMAGHRVAAIGYHGATGTPDHLSEISINAL